MPPLLKEAAIAKTLETADLMSAEYQDELIVDVQEEVLADENAVSQLKEIYVSLSEIPIKILPEPSHETPPEMLAMNQQNVQENLAESSELEEVSRSNNQITEQK